MKNNIFVLVIFVLFSFFNKCSIDTPSYDIVIKSGKIIDGTGNPWFFGNIGIRGDRIAKVGKIDEVYAKKIIDANGLYVVPGFIDVHTHVDVLIDSLTDVKNYLLQGVTTAVGGNCGSSRFPLSDLFQNLEENKIAINFASLVGHNTILRQVIGFEDRTPTADEMSQMKELVKNEMECGAIGFSTGLGYIPGRYSTTEEIIELTKQVTPYNGVYATHLREQGLYIKDAIEEAVRIGFEASMPVQISHIKLSDDAVWGKYELITDPIEKARKNGLEIYLDQYPYIATSTSFSSSFEGWVIAGGHKAFVERMKDPENYKKAKAGVIKKRFTSTKGINKLETIYISNNKNHREYEGKNIAEILDMLGKEKTISNAADLVIEMHKNDQPSCVFFQMNEVDVAHLMKKPYNMHASDGTIEIPGVQIPHPRAYGTFPRVLRKYVREESVLSLSDAIRKMTSLPAQAMGFYDRSVLKEGCFADLVLFDLEKIKDTATFPEPHQYPEGISWIIVNGKVAVQNGEIKNGRSGRVLYGKGKAE